jgi:hypothetical protein
MTTIIYETKITFKYLMNRTKRELATWILTQLDFIADLENFHPRAMKLMRKKKNFIVIACDEPYFEMAYHQIKLEELLKGTWTEEDERIYQSCVSSISMPIKRSK